MGLPPVWERQGAPPFRSDPPLDAPHWRTPVVASPSSPLLPLSCVVVLAACRCALRCYIGDMRESVATDAMEGMQA